MKRLVFATRNAHKVRELSEMIAPLGLEAVTLDSIAPHAPEVEENGATFAENAALKAISAYHATGGVPSIADDSGICVEALGGAPGIFSARYAGASATDQDNNDALLQALRDETERNAHFFCALALVCRRSDVRDEATIITQWPGLPEGAVLVQMEGRVDGVIARTESGQGGFGYDPLFFVPELGCTFAEVPSDEKHALSHRGQAFRRLLNVLEERTSLKKTTRDLDLSSGS